MIKRILFVCTGNTCRSPMAQVLFESIISKDPSLQSAGIKVDSAGIIANRYPAPQEAIEVMLDYGLDLTGHRSKLIDSSMLDWADLVLVMEQEHKEGVVSRFPEQGGKTHLLSEYVGERGDIPDPYYGDIQVYRECATLLQSLLNKLADKLGSKRAGEKECPPRATGAM